MGLACVSQIQYLYVTFSTTVNHTLPITLAQKLAQFYCKSLSNEVIVGQIGV